MVPSLLPELKDGEIPPGHLLQHLDVVCRILLDGIAIILRAVLGEDDEGLVRLCGGGGRGLGGHLHRGGRGSLIARGTEEALVPLHVLQFPGERVQPHVPREGVAPPPGGGGLGPLLDALRYVQSSLTGHLRGASQDLCTIDGQTGSSAHMCLDHALLVLLRGSGWSLFVGGQALQGERGERGDGAGEFGLRSTQVAGVLPGGRDLIGIRNGGAVPDCLPQGSKGFGFDDIRGTDSRARSKEVDLCGCRQWRLGGVTIASHQLLSLQPVDGGLLDGDPGADVAYGKAPEAIRRLC